MGTTYRRISRAINQNYSYFIIVVRTLERQRRRTPPHMITVPVLVLLLFAMPPTTYDASHVCARRARRASDPIAAHTTALSSHIRRHHTSASRRLVCTSNLMRIMLRTNVQAYMDTRSLQLRARATVTSTAELCAHATCMHRSNKLIHRRRIHLNHLNKIFRLFPPGHTVKHTMLE